MSDGTASRLRALVEGDAAAVSAALHADVVFVQGDGTEHRGAEAVLAVFAASGEEGVRYTVVAVADRAVEVELTVAGIAGAVRFTLRGTSEAGRLSRVRVET